MKHILLYRLAQREGSEGIKVVHFIPIWVVHLKVIGKYDTGGEVVDKV